MKKLDLSSLKKYLKPSIILVLLFLALLGAEAYILYYKVYGNLFTTIEEMGTDINIVRLDINNYNKMITLLDSLKDFQPNNPVLENPFK